MSVWSVCLVQVHTFYEAVGLMIGAQTDQVQQERLIEKYMSLPNQVWDSIINQATQVSTLSHQGCVLCMCEYRYNQQANTASLMLCLQGWKLALVTSRSFFIFLGVGGRNFEWASKISYFFNTEYRIWELLGR